jgi:hypothetical protein
MVNPDRFNTQRTTDGRLFGNVGRTWVPFNPIEAFAIVDDLITEAGGKAWIEACGALDGGNQLVELAVRGIHGNRRLDDRGSRLAGCCRRHDDGNHYDGRLDAADTISIELTARDDSCTSEVDLMRKYPEFDGADSRRTERL